MTRGGGAVTAVAETTANRIALALSCSSPARHQTALPHL